jgi:hypothetical protein
MTVRFNVKFLFGLSSLLLVENNHHALAAGVRSSATRIRTNDQHGSSGMTNLEYMSQQLQEEKETIDQTIDEELNLIAIQQFAMSMTTAPSMSSSPSMAPSPGDVLTEMPSDIPSDIPEGPLTNTSSPTVSTMPSDSPTTSPLVPSSLPTMPPSVSVLPSDIPTTAPTMSSAPSSLPTEGGDGCNQTPVQRSITIFALLDPLMADPSLLRDPTTPQGKATDFIIGQDERLVCPDDEKILQRWVLAVMYYSTGGDEWTQCSADETVQDFCGSAFPFENGQERFLSASNECEWAGISCNFQNCVTEIEFGTT